MFCPDEKPPTPSENTNDELKLLGELKEDGSISEVSDKFGAGNQL